MLMFILIVEDIATLHSYTGGGMALPFGMELPPPELTVFLCFKLTVRVSVTSARHQQFGNFG